MLEIVLESVRDREDTNPSEVDEASEIQHSSVRDVTSILHEVTHIVNNPYYKMSNLIFF